MPAQLWCLLPCLHPTKFRALLISQSETGGGEDWAVKPASGLGRVLQKWLLTAGFLSPRKQNCSVAAGARVALPGILLGFICCRVVGNICPFFGQQSHSIIQQEVPVSLPCFFCLLIFSVFFPFHIYSHGKCMKSGRNKFLSWS